jgi:hypothetical protein
MDPHNGKIITPIVDTEPHLISQIMDTISPLCTTNSGNFDDNHSSHRKLQSKDDSSSSESSLEKNYQPKRIETTVNAISPSCFVEPIRYESSNVNDVIHDSFRSLDESCEPKEGEKSNIVVNDEDFNTQPTVNVNVSDTDNIGTFLGAH